MIPLRSRNGCPSRRQRSESSGLQCGSGGGIERTPIGQLLLHGRAFVGLNGLKGSVRIHWFGDSVATGSGLTIPSVYRLPLVPRAACAGVESTIHISKLASGSVPFTPNIVPSVSDCILVAQAPPRDFEGREVALKWTPSPSVG
jgi:hypothetical protein